MKKTAFILLLGVFCGHFSAFAQEPVVLDKIIARVNNYIVLKSDLEKAVMQMIRSTGKMPTTEVRCQMLQQLIVNKMLLAKAEIDSVYAEPSAIDNELDRRMGYMIQQAGGKQEELERHFGKTVSTLKDELRSDVKEMLTVQKMQREITKDVKVTPRQVKRFFDGFPKDSIPFLPSEYEVGQILKTPSVSKNVKDEVRALLLDFKSKVLANKADFERLARANSEDLGSAAQGGNLGWAGRGQMVPPYEAMALSLKPGEIGDPVESDFGLHLVQLLERRGNRYNSRHILIRPKPTEQDIEKTRVYLDSIRDRILKDSITFERAANQISDDKMTKMNGGIFKDYESGSTRMSGQQLDYMVYMTVDTMKVGNITKPKEFRTEDGKTTLRMIYFKSKMPSHQANLNDDYEKIQTMAMAEEKAKILEKWFERTQSSLFIDIDPDYNHCNLLPTN
jgi:peptidyl-prolyl cis-trans isomerase SurA